MHIATTPPYVIIPIKLTRGVIYELSKMQKQQYNRASYTNGQHNQNKGHGLFIWADKIIADILYLWIMASAWQEKGNKHNNIQE